MASETFRLDTPAGRALEGVIDLPAGDGPFPTVVICHGFKGFFEWGFFPYLAELLRERGFAAVRFNFSGAGMRPGDETVTDLAAFRDNTLSRERDDLEAVLAAVGGEIGGSRLDPHRMGLVGHSRGGGAALLASASDAWQRRIRSLVTWSAVSRIDRFSSTVMETWRENGELELMNVRTGQKLTLGPELYAEIDELPPELDLFAAAARRTAPWLIVHGEKDETVPVGEAHDLAAAARQPAELCLVSEGSHTFGARHPWSGPTAPLIEALNATQTWFRRTLAST